MDKDYRKLILQFIGSLTLADHMGDVSNDIEYVLIKLGVPVAWEDLSSLGDALGKMGITTLHGTSLVDEETCSV